MQEENIPPIASTHLRGCFLILCVLWLCSIQRYILQGYKVHVPIDPLPLYKINNIQYKNPNFTNIIISDMWLMNGVRNEITQNEDKKRKKKEETPAVGRIRTYAPKGNLISSQTP